MRFLPAVLLALPMFAACGGDDGEVAGVFPESGFVGRTTRVAVVGDGTSWGSGTTVDFGPGVTVSAVEVASPSALFVDLTIDPTATPGAVDISVDGQTLPAGFMLASPVEVETLLPLAQGGLSLYSISNLDLLNPFDTTVDEETGEFVGVTVTADGTGIDAFVADVSEFEIIIQASADLDATGGALTITSGGLVSLLNNADVIARTPTPLTVGTPITDTLDGSALYEVNLTSDQLLALEVEADSTDANLNFVLLPASGKWADTTAGFTSSDNLLVSNGDKFYLSVLDLDLLSGYGYTVSATTAVDLDGVAETPEAEPNETSAAATTGTGAVVHFTAVLADDVDVDFFKVTVADGQTLRVRTTAGPAGITDTEISIFNPNGTTPTKDANGENIVGFDVGVGDDVETETLTAGTYFIKIEVSFIGSVFLGYVPANDPYDAIVTVQ